MALSSSPDAPVRERTSARVHVQKFGTFLSNMVMPNIAAFIAWGFITALFIEAGWVNLIAGGDLSPGGLIARIGGWGEFAGGGIVAPMITYLLPLLIGYTGGRNIYDMRGGVVGAIATMGIIAGTDIPMFLGAMIMGPLGGWSMMKLDALWTHKIRPGFEMLVNNFSAGIWGMILAIIAFYLVSPVVTALSHGAGRVVAFLVESNLLPLTSLLIEPAKVLFLNNAINHGILTPLGTAEAVETGKSVLFLLEANPGPGLGLLLAFTFFGRGAARASAPGAALIHFVGGIHEIYFPYVLMKPKLIAATILGGMAGILTNLLFASGLRSPAAPGSIIAVWFAAPPSSLLGVTASVVVAATVSFLVAAFLLKTDKAVDQGDLAAATASMESLKGKKSVASSALSAGSTSIAATASTDRPIHKIVFACDAGMGSSAMGASVLRRKIQDAGFGNVTVVNKAISTLSDEWDLVVTHQDLTPRAQQRTGSAVQVSVDNFMGSPRYDEIVDLLRRTNDDAPTPAAPAAQAEDPSAGSVLNRRSIILDGTARTRDDAIDEAGRLLVAEGAVSEAYVEAMHERETSVSTHMGNGLAIPHGTNEAKSAINRSAISFVRYPQGIDWNGKPVTFVVGIAGAGNSHLALLGRLAKVFAQKEQVARLEAATSVEEIEEILGGVQA